MTRRRATLELFSTPLTPQQTRSPMTAGNGAVTRDNGVRNRLDAEPPLSGRHRHLATPWHVNNRAAAGDNKTTIGRMRGRASASYGRKKCDSEKGVEWRHFLNKGE